MAKQVPFAITYDFDGTLAPGNMQEHSFIPDCGLSKAQFWTEVKKYAQDHDMDEILAYMFLMLDKAKAQHKPINRKAFQEHAKTIKFFPGIEGWFDRINQYGKERGFKVEHYIISSGLREMIEATKIGKKFKYIYASGFKFDVHDVAEWPALAVNYTTKTQYLFRINKGIENSYDNSKINKFMAEQDRPVPFTNMIYLGDGETDIPAMKMLKYQKGYSIAVYDPSKRGTKTKLSQKKMALNLLEEQRADFAQPTDYTEGSALDKLVKHIINKVAEEQALMKLRQ